MLTLMVIHVHSLSKSLVQRYVGERMVLASEVYSFEGSRLEGFQFDGSRLEGPPI